MFDADFFKAEIPNYLSGKRLSHTFAVTEECERLADIFGVEGIDRERLLCAALLHDITKEKKGREQIDLLRKLNAEYDSDDLNSPKILHAITGAAFIRRQWPDRTDDEMALLIRSHTTGRPGMGLCEKLLYLADYIEPTRDWESCVTLRRFFKKEPAAVKNDPQKLLKHLDRTLVLSFDLTIAELIESGSVISMKAVAARNQLLISLDA
ncbi:MAG TPA: HD domain-containing protein [Clostridiales bacterium]|jgi:predicted HD superfamily hydrolase involved in NAD metabolism|nr:HD domain-containing protein [Clostridiales bacterium]